MILAAYSDPADATLFDTIDDGYPFPFSPQYAAFLEKHKGENHFLVFADDRQTCLPVRQYKIRKWTFMQCLFPPVRAGERLSKIEEQAFLDDLIAFAGASKLCHRFVQPATFALFQAYPDGSSYCPFGTYRVMLQERTEEEIFGAFQARYRSAVNSAGRSGAIIRSGADQVPVFHRLYAQTMERSKMSVNDLSFYQDLAGHMGESHAHCAVVYFEDQPVGGIFVLYSTFGAYYLWGSSAATTKLSGLIKFLHWEVMKWARNKGVREYDFVGARLSDVSGTRLEGIQKFKARFGSQLEEGVLWKMDIDGKAIRSFDRILWWKQLLKGKKPPTDIIDQENAKM